MILWHITMSLDACIAGPRHEMDFLQVMDASEPNPIGDAVRDRSGAILAGRNWYDAATAHYKGRHGIYGGSWTGPVFVLTHQPPEGAADPEITFLSTTVDSAVEKAQHAAGPGDVGIFGADLARQCLELGLIDEIVVHMAPILLGDGIRLYRGASPIELELVEADRQSLRYRVVP